jgi:hypothetical protein
MVAGVPWFIDNRQLRSAVWLIVEAIRTPIIERLDRIMSLVTVDSDALAAVGPAIAALETEFENFVAALPTPPPAGSLDSVNAALTDFKSKLDAATTPATPAAPADPGTGASTGTAGDGSTTTVDPSTGTTAVDPNTGQPVVDPNAPTA